jgi:glycosyltransferase involved in cell wall biosynthesis
MDKSWIVFQIGAREHYAVARALHGAGKLAALITDLWAPPGSAYGKIPGSRRLRDRWHADLADAEVLAPNVRMLALELSARLRGRQGWPLIMARNALFQREAIRLLKKLTMQAPQKGSPTLFSYSYAALELFRYAKERGWRTVMGQIDPGPEEERLVTAERQRYAGLPCRWEPAPPVCWDSWRKEIELADEVIVNSEWSRHCLLKEGVPPEKMRVIPLVYELTSETARSSSRILGGGGRSIAAEPTAANNQRAFATSPLRVLFLGQVNLRKGVPRLIDAMRLLRDEPIQLTLAGPSDFDPALWADLPNVGWVGSVARSEVSRFYSEADVFILPTLSDGYALTQLEALAHGLPVIASKHCGEAVSDGVNGWILSDLEPATIACALRQLLYSPRLACPLALPPLKLVLGNGRFELNDLALSLIKPNSAPYSEELSASSHRAR